MHSLIIKSTNTASWWKAGGKNGACRTLNLGLVYDYTMEFLEDIEASRLCRQRLSEVQACVRLPTAAPI